MTGVLVVGAGPTGLATAAHLHANGGRVRIVERRVGAQDSRAIVVHPRTLEVLAPLGLADELIERGDPSARVLLHAGRRTAQVRLSHPGVGDTPYPFLLAIPQVTVEQVLEERLLRMGVEVEHGVEIVALAQGPDSVEFELHGPGGRHERGESAYLVGCDGADSTVRRLAAIPFPCRAYRPTVLLADLDVEDSGDLAHGIFHGYIGAGGVLFLFPSPGSPSSDTAPWRLLVVSPNRTPATRAALQDAADRITNGALRLGDPVWSSAVHLCRGQAGRYRDGRVLLAGDAAHVHSPAGAQGMNTGLQDAGNLGWKLAVAAAATTGGCCEALLDSYQAERWPVARRVRQLTDLAFLGEAADATALRWLRRHVAPPMLPLVHGRAVPQWAFRLAGGLSVHYRHSPVVEEGTPPLRGGVPAGDRLPDLPIGHDRRLHELLRQPGFHLLLLGHAADANPDTGPDAADELRRVAAIPLHIHRLADPPVGLPVPAAGGVYLVRPDGYVGYRSTAAGLDGVRRHLARTLDWRPGGWSTSTRKEMRDASAL